MINAKAETPQERPTYRVLVPRAERRCLLLAGGWYKWQRPEDGATRGTGRTNPFASKVTIV